MNLLLIIQDTDHLPYHLEQVNKFLIFRRQNSKDKDSPDKVFGIWSQQKSHLDPLRYTKEENDHPRKNHGIQILESVSFGGWWTLCWIDHPFLGNFNSSSEQRITLLEHLISSKSLAHLINKTGKFFPVFGETDSPEMVAAMMTELKNRHPTLIGKRWFIENKKEGIIIQAENHPPS